MRRNYNRLTGALTAVTLTAALGCAACGKGGNTETCSTPRAVSDLTPGDTDPSVTSDPKTWRLGRLIMSAPSDPTNYISRVVGFRNPNAPGDLWHDSKPIPDTGGLSIIVKEGPGPALFSVYDINRAGPNGCDSAPPTEFSAPTPIADLVKDNDHLIAPTWP